MTLQIIGTVAALATVALVWGWALCRIASDRRVLMNNERRWEFVRHERSGRE